MYQAEPLPYILDNVIPLAAVPSWAEVDSQQEHTVADTEADHTAVDIAVDHRVADTEAVVNTVEVVHMVGTGLFAHSSSV